MTTILFTQQKQPVLRAFAHSRSAESHGGQIRLDPSTLLQKVQAAKLSNLIKECFYPSPHYKSILDPLNLLHWTVFIIFRLRETMTSFS